MAQKKSPDISPERRRKSIEADVQAYLAAGNKIEEVASGVSSQVSQAQSKPLRTKPTKENKEGKEGTA